MCFRDVLHSPDGNKYDQTDCILLSKRFRSGVQTAKPRSLWQRPRFVKTDFQNSANEVSKLRVLAVWATEKGEQR